MHQFYGEIEMRILGLVMCFALMLWIMNMAAGIAAFIDLISLSVVFGGGIAYAIAKGGVSQSRDQALLNFADGAVYWGWLGFLVGCVGSLRLLCEMDDHGRSRYQRRLNLWESKG